MLDDWLGKLVQTVSEKKQAPLVECECKTDVRKITFRGKLLCEFCLRKEILRCLE